MALSDPSNVRVGLARKRKLAQKLAAQIAAKGGRGQGRAGAGRAFRSSSDLLASVAPRFAFQAPAARGIRPRGFGQNDVFGGQGELLNAQPPVLTQGGGIGGGGTQVGSDPVATGGDVYSAPDINTATFGSGVPGSPALNPQSPQDQAFFNLAQESGFYDPYGPTGAQLRPNVWQSWMDAKIKQLQGLQ